MKKIAIVCSAVYLLTMSAEISAQTRGPHYNPPSSSGSSHPSSSGSSHPSSSGSSHPSSSGSSHPSSSSTHGPSYHPPSSSSSSSSTHTTHYNPPSSSGSTPSTSTTPHGPRYNPPGTSVGTSHVPHGPRYNPPGNIHTPVLVHTTVIHFGGPRDYYSSINSHYIYYRWVQYPVQYWYTDGYWEMDGYPYYVNRGYRYRYNPVEMCQYELVDAENNSTIKAYPLQACTTAYDQCAVERDTMNRTIGLERYFCAEAVDADLAQTQNTDYQGSAVEMTEAKRAAIASYLEDMSYKDIFHDAFNNGVGTCSITNVGGMFGNRNAYNCKYQVNVGTKAYPAVNGSVCSDDAQAAQVDCSVGNEKENAGCILKQAIESGYCH